ncbi:GfV-B29-ORF1 [Ichnoviriform fumiferanae]|uniref:GfV-B29-ORF1 n=1 Tax=Ichnoviriform fumiferanae TaxID=419435 RepID=A2PZT0_9VIRU|nr:GfV-B29-ORF1 [Ichnoviriform fumiferanae]BAF45502.1 GfV-B29-ORF1 [Ichnoviriform fumiferanae]
MKMDNTTLVQMISWRDGYGENFFHQVCRAGSFQLLERIQPYMTEDLRHLLEVTNYQGKPCMHVAVSSPSVSIYIMKILRTMGADINSKSNTGGFAVLHEAVVHKAYAIAEWLCQQPDIQLNAITWGDLTPYQLAYTHNDSKMMDILKKYGADTSPPPVSSSEEESN